MILVTGTLYYLRRHLRKKNAIREQIKAIKTIKRSLEKEINQGPKEIVREIKGLVKEEKSVVKKYIEQELREAKSIVKKSRKNLIR